MKKITINFLIITALFTAAFTSCKSRGSGNVKLIESMTSKTPDGVFTVKFEYDDENRIVKTLNHFDGRILYTETITYNCDGSVKIVNDNIDDEKIVETHFIKNANTITVQSSDISYGTDAITVNKDGYILKRERSYGSGEDGSWSEIINWQYQTGNFTKLTTAFHSISTSDRFPTQEFKYDNKKSPLYHCKTPKWLLAFYNIGLNNNIVERRYYDNINEDWSETYTYEYDSDGFPIRQTMKLKDGAKSEYMLLPEKITIYAYRSKTAEQTL